MMFSSLLVAAAMITPVAPRVVRVNQSGGQFQLTVDGQPYFVKGVGGSSHLDLFVASGGNTFRTWGAENLQRDLDEAHKRGLMVCAGIWLQHSNGFDYRDQARVKKQFDEAIAVVKKFKDHPALLMWAFGNEMEAFGDGGDSAVWTAVNDIAKAAKTIDKNHPTMSVTADIGGGRVPGMNKYCPDVDIHGINSYGGALNLPARYKKAGGVKPYLLTEFGPLGTWEVAKTAWGAPIEQSSTAKVMTYREAYLTSVKGNPAQCLGSFAFLWGNKQEGTSTWFGMLLPDGTRTGAVDLMTEFWSGKKPKNLCPEIQSLEVAQTDGLKPGSVIKAALRASDPEKGILTVNWALVGETEEYLTAGRDEKVPPKHPGAFVTGNSTSATFKMPSTKGAYRVFAYVYDSHGGAAVANVPVRVE
jgi:hypothetical protein